MSQILQRIDSIGRREATTLAAATTQRVFASISTTSCATRQGINLTNADASADLFVALTAAGAAAPTVSTTYHDLIVAPRTSRQILVGPGIDLWIRSSSAGAINYTALELL